jgi:probable rRNA maturation factor
VPAITINFFAQSITLKLKKRKILKKFLIDLINRENAGMKSGEVNVIFCVDNYLHNLNKKYLQHTTLTDIITFDYSAGNRLIGDIFISVERVKENAKKYSQPYTTELIRIIIHGFLHLFGYKDKNENDKQQMTQMENYYLEVFKKGIIANNYKGG